MRRERIDWNTGNEPVFERLAFRGGTWNNGANAGVFTLNGNNPRSNSDANVGFRSAFLYSLKSFAHGRMSRAEERKGFVSFRVFKREE